MIDIFFHYFTLIWTHRSHNVNIQLFVYPMVGTMRQQGIPFTNKRVIDMNASEDLNHTKMTFTSGNRYSVFLHSLVPGEFELNFRKWNWKLILVTGDWAISCKVGLRWKATWVKALISGKLLIVRTCTNCWILSTSRQNGVHGGHEYFTSCSIRQIMCITTEFWCCRRVLANYSATIKAVLLITIHFATASYLCSTKR